MRCRDAERGRQGRHAEAHQRVSLARRSRADDGERVTLVEFQDEATQRGWATNLQHVEAKKKGRADCYTEYKLQVCEVKYQHAFTAGAESAQEA